MEFLKRFMLSKPREQRVLLMAIALLFVSQFFLYFNDEGGGYLTNAMNTDYYTGLTLTFGRVERGWSAHPLALVLIPALAFAFIRDDLVRRYAGDLFDRFGYWAACVLFFLCITPGAPMRAFGATLGFIALVAAIVAAVMHHRARKAAP